jgi:hypothetical protein
MPIFVMLAQVYYYHANPRYSTVRRPMDDHVVTAKK